MAAYVARRSIRFYTQDMVPGAEISRLREVREYRSIVRKSVKRMKLWFLWASILLVPTVGRACSCSPPGPVSSIKIGDSVIFRGIATEVTNIRDAHVFRAYRVHFVVKEVFSGNPEPEEIVYTSHPMACGFNFEPGSEYVVFTYRNAYDNTLGTSMCSRTAKLSAGIDNESVTWMRAHIKHSPSTSHQVKHRGQTK
jgi:hypothetical protein